jgi:glucan 1,3-beta-glucosidase
MVYFIGGSWVCSLKRDVTQFAGCKIIFFDAGVYYVTNTITIPAGTQIVGEAWSVILAGGRNFQSQTNPRPVIRAGTAGSKGAMEISDLLLTTAGPGKQYLSLSARVITTH